MKIMHLMRSLQTRKEHMKKLSIEHNYLRITTLMLGFHQRSHCFISRAMQLKRHQTHRTGEGGTCHIDLSDKTFPVMIKLIAESLTGGLDYQDVYDEDSENVNGTRTILDNNHVEMPIPTLDGIA